MDHQIALSELLGVAPRDLRGVMTLKNNVYIAHRRNGVLIAEREGHNLVTGAGLAAIASRIVLSSVSPFTYIGVGRTNTAEALTQTALAQEVKEDGTDDPTNHVLATTIDTVASGDTDEGNDTARLVATFTFTGGVAIVESGVFNQQARVGGTMLARQTFAALNVVNGDSLTITWRFNLSNAA